MRFSRKEYWSGLPCPPPGDLPDPGIAPRSLTLQVDSLLAEPHTILYFWLAFRDSPCCFPAPMSAFDKVFLWTSNTSLAMVSLFLKSDHLILSEFGIMLSATLTKHCMFYTVSYKVLKKLRNIRLKKLILKLYVSYIFKEYAPCFSSTSIKLFTWSISNTVHLFMCVFTWWLRW